MRSFRLVLLVLLCFASLVLPPGELLGQPPNGQPTSEGSSDRAHGPVCGTNPGLADRLLEFHASNVENRKPTPPRLGPPDQDMGEIAVLVDDGTLIIGGTTDSLSITSRFYESHPDLWDFVVIFTNFNTFPEAGFAFELNVRGLVGGIGYSNFFGFNTFNGASGFGFPTERLSSLLNMNSLVVYTGPEDDISGFPGSVTGTEVMGQEAGHRFGSFLQADNADVLGRGEAHWSFFYESEASVMEGNGWLDNGGGSFTTVESFNNLGQMDDYYWGLRPAQDVTVSAFVITNPVPNMSDSSFPIEGVNVTGNRVNVDISNFIGANGPRVPDASEAAHDFKYAYILVVPQGTSPSLADLNEINAFRTSWETYFDIQTDGLGSADTALTSAEFTADVNEGMGPLTVQFTDQSYGAISSRTWDFGDGNGSNALNPSHTYTEPGVFDVSLTVVAPSATRTQTKVGFVVVGESVPLFADFESPTGWTVGDVGDTATGGIWIRRDPNPTFDMDTNFIPQTDDDHTAGAGVRALVTGNATQAGPNDDDVDGGVTSVLSPVFDLDGETSATLVYYRYGYNKSMSDEDRFSVDLSNNGGTDWTNLESTANLQPTYVRRVLSLDGVLPFTADMRLRIQQRDDGADNVVESIVDDVSVLTTAVGPAEGCDLAVASAVVDFDPMTPAIDPGPGAMGQDLDVVVTVTNEGSFPITSAELTATASLGPLSVQRTVTVTDFDPVAGTQELAPGGMATVIVPFEALVLQRCGLYSLAVSSNGAALICRDGGSMVVGDADTANDQLTSPPSIQLDMGVITLDILTVSETIESVATERLRMDAGIQGFTSGLPPVVAVFTFDIVDGGDPNTVIFANARNPHMRTVQTDLARMATISVGLNTNPSLPLNTPLRVRVTMTDTVTGDQCSVGISDPFVITG